MKNFSFNSVHFCTMEFKKTQIRGVWFAFILIAKFDDTDKKEWMPPYVFPSFLCKDLEILSA